jgi:hypothetical protein
MKITSYDLIVYSVRLYQWECHGTVLARGRIVPGLCASLRIVKSIFLFIVRSPIYTHDDVKDEFTYKFIFTSGSATVHVVSNLSCRVIHSF